MQTIQTFDRSTLVPEVERPDPEIVIEGDPEHTTWLAEDRDGLYCGMWQCTPGKWKVSYSEWEYIRVHSGLSILIGDDGSETRLAAGTSLIIRPGFTGIWHCVETMLKDFVILE
ncbi:cupin domain-containing protein [Frigidibacter sp. MR17.14]|uniref:cupin domain-containing protein n=1 Tax=Frigidibacter sp. MR17.14 TaxID=3126509 RepID=UPI003012B756